MRSRCTSKHGSRSMEVERPKLKEEPRLSGAYIRSLVKQLSSSMPKGPMNPKSLDGAAGDHEESPNLPELGEGSSQAQQQHRQQEKADPPRKQTRRRVHTSRPYQERLINMAEARREIVTALKLHRAAMKRESEQQRQQQQEKLQPVEPLQVIPSPPPTLQELQKEIIDREINSRIYPSNNSLNMLFSYFNSPSLPSASYPPNSWPYSSTAPLPIHDNPSFTLATRPLGLNLNLHHFNNIDINPFYNNSSEPPIVSSSTSFTSSSSCSHSLASHVTGMPPSGVSAASGAPLRAPEGASSEPPVGTLHPMMGDEEMAEIRSIGEQHDMEWNDKLNLVTSAWWCNLLKAMEASPQAQEARNKGDGIVGNGLGVSDEVMDMPAWLRDQQYVDDHYYHSEEYLKDASLPSLDIGEIEGTDCEWL